VVADARLDNLSELRDDLDATNTSTPAEILARAYFKWGVEFPEHLAGDFAVVLWDAAERRVLAVRDPFGVKSLFYRLSSERIWFASREARILGTFSGFPEVDERSVVEYLLGVYRSVDATFFREIRRVPAGHLLIIRPSEIRATRFWKPLSSFVNRKKAQPTDQVLEEFRRLFKRAILRRIQSTAGAIVHVSGGVDSSSIAVACDLLSREIDAMPRLIGASAAFPGLRCDEGSYISAIETKVRFPIERWDGTSPNAVDILDPAAERPGARCAFIDGMLGDLEIAKREDISVILSGNGGDELTINTGTTRDMVAAHEWIRAINRLLFYGDRDGSSRAGRVKSFLGQCLPLRARAWRARARAIAGVPSWLVPELRSVARDILQPEMSNAKGSHAEEHVWNRLNSQQLIRGVEAHQMQALSFGVEYRFPFLDRDLVRLVLSMAGGYWPFGTRPHQKALSEDLPSAVANRASKADLTPALANRLSRAASPIEDQFLKGRWASERYVVRELAASEWRAFDRQTAQGIQCRRMWSVVTLEAWLRKVFGYSSPQEA
jgi:asparagine synthase (glutamine-hydrolysing)